MEIKFCNRLKYLLIQILDKLTRHCTVGLISPKPENELDSIFLVTILLITTFDGSLTHSPLAAPEVMFTVCVWVLDWKVTHDGEVGLCKLNLGYI